MNKLIELDQQLFSLLNSFNTPFMDVVMEFITGRYSWIPLYLFLIWLVIKRFKKQAVLVLVFIIALVALTDLTSVHLFKNVFERLRPCHFLEDVHIINNHCGGQYGFVSSHAANVFGLAFFYIFLLGKQLKWLSYVLLVWAIVVSYSRIYLGVHYPLDIFCGALLGVFMAFAIFKIYESISNKIYK